MIACEIDPAIRLRAGEIIGEFGDDRYTNFEMLKVPEGEFIRGSKENDFYSREEPQRNIYLDTFFIGKFPITNREFKEFIDAGGYKSNEFWTSIGWHYICERKIAEPDFWHDHKWNFPNFPVVGVSWYECNAFCNWLSKRTGFHFRLPTEAEWEKASRWIDGRDWPWGNESNVKMCNSGDLDLNRTTPIGIFPQSVSHYGCVDIAGNVLEWCNDWFSSKYYFDCPSNNPEGPSCGERRVLRGGSWFGRLIDCRCASRISVVPTLRSDDVGFRLARSV